METDFVATLLANQDFEIGFKLCLALFLGMLLGIERAIAGKSAGMRTYGFVTMGSTIFVILGILATGGYGNAVFSDASARITAAIIQGIGFIGAGLIILRGSRVSGTTTAAAIWVSAGIGVAVGYGFYFIAIIATILALFVFTVIWYVEHRLKTMARFTEDDTTKE